MKMLRTQDNSTNTSEVSLKIDDEYYRKLAMVESGGRANAAASTSSAVGLFQFTEGTWKALVNQMGLNFTLEDRKDPVKSRIVVERMTEDHYKALKKRMGQEPSFTDLYMAHFLGIGGAVRFLTADLESYAANVVGDRVAKANKAVFFDKNGVPLKVKDVYAKFQRKFDNA